MTGPAGRPPAQGDVAARPAIGYAAAAMSAALQEQVFELHPQPTRSLRHLQAWRDVTGAARLWRLCLTLGWLDIKLRYRGSALGPFWLTLSTAVMVASMGLIYATLFRMNLHDYLPYLAVSQVLWAFLSQLVGEGCTCFLQAEGMIRSMRMPYTVHAARVVVRNLLVLAHTIVVIVVVFVMFGVWPGWRGLLVVPAIAVWLIDAIAICLLLGTFCARFRDIPPIVASIMQIAFFVSPVIWRPELLGARAWVMVFNPFYTLLQIVRGPLMGEPTGMRVWASALFFSGVLWLTSALLFARVRGRLSFWV